jgi:hypothetical protein
MVAEPAMVQQSCDHVPTQKKESTMSIKECLIFAAGIAVFYMLAFSRHYGWLPLFVN